MKHFVIFIGFILLFFSCSKDNRNFISKTITLNPFDTLEIAKGHHVTLIQSNENKIVITAWEKEMNNIFVIERNNNVKLTDKRYLKFLRPKDRVNIDVYATNLDEIWVIDGCVVKTREPLTFSKFGVVVKGLGSEVDIAVNSQEFYYWNNYFTGGKLTLRGNTNYLEVWNLERVNFDAINLVAKEAFVNNQSGGDCLVYATDKLEYTIKGSGNIYLYGNPSIIINSTDPNERGKGEFIKK